MNLNARMNDGIYEIATLDGLPSDRIIRYATITADMLNHTELATMFAPSFWADRWITLATYSHEYDNDTYSSEPYNHDLMRTPEGRMFVSENPEIQEAMSPVTMTCNGVCWSCSAVSSSLSSSQPAKSRCSQTTRLRLFPYTILLQQFIVSAALN